MIIGRGQLQHHFWGSYAATIGIAFDSDADATDAQKLLPDFKQRGKALVWHGNGPDVDRIEALLVSFGADPDKIGSIAKSIDYGEPFTVTMPVHRVSQVETLF
jgi:hypothetical protein